MIFTNEDRLKEKYGDLYDKFNQIRHLAAPDDKLRKVEELVVDICNKNNIPTRLPSGKMRWEIWEKMASILRDMGILVEPNPNTVDIGGLEEMMTGKEYPKFPEWEDVGKTERIPIPDFGNSIKEPGLPKIEDFIIEYDPIFKPEPTIEKSKLSGLEDSFNSFH